MADRIDYPPTLQGDELSQLRQLYNYLYQTAEILNGNLQAIGGNELSDEDLAVMRDVLRTPAEEAGPEDALAQVSREAETLKSLIIKTAEFVRTAIDEYNIKLIGTTEAEGKLGKYVRHTGLDVAVTPEGITQNYTFAEIIQGLRVFEINAKNYIKTGYLRTVNSIPIYGVAIGKDIVTFSADGTETYNDGNKVAELTADALSFYQGGTLVAKYTGSRVSFYSNGAEVMYITNGAIYATQDLILSSGKMLQVVVGNSGNSWKFNQNGLSYCNSNNVPMIQFGKASEKSSDAQAGVYADSDGSGYASTQFIRFETKKSGYPYYLMVECDSVGFLTLRPDTDQFGNLGKSNKRFNLVYFTFEYVNTVYYQQLIQESSRDVKHDIRDMESLGEKLDALRPVTFVYDSDTEEKSRTGLIYEETVEILPEICQEKDGTKTLNYVEMIPMLLKEIQDLRQRVKRLEGGE